MREFWGESLAQELGLLGERDNPRVLLEVVAFGSDPVPRTAKDWLELAGIPDGRAFRPKLRHEQLSIKRLTDHAVVVIVKRTADKAGLATPELSGHLLRAGSPLKTGGPMRKTSSLARRHGHGCRFGGS